jgi:hypothetical protein
LLGQQERRLESGPVPISITNPEIDILAREIAFPVGGEKLQIDLGMAPLERIQPWNEPKRGERCWQG